MIRISCRLAIAIAVTLVTLAIPHSARACSCVYPTPELVEYADEIDLAFVGRQIDRLKEDVVVGEIVTDEGVALRTKRRATLVFEVDRVYKGVVGPLVELRTEEDSSLCGANFSYANTIGITAWRVEVVTSWLAEEGDLTVGLCDLTGTIEEFEDAFGAGYLPDEIVLLSEPTDESDDRSGTYLRSDETILLESPSQPTRTRQVVAGGIALIVLGAGLIAIRNRRRPEGR